LPNPTPDGVRVVEAHRRDIPSIRTFILDAWMVAGPSAWGWTGATEENIQALASSEHLVRLISSSEVRVLLAREEGRVVGFAATRESDPETIELAGIIVDEHHTGKGVGTALTRKALEVAANLGYREAVVKTETFNKRAIAFYERNDFARAGSVTEDVDGRKIELVVLRRRLK